jgi:group I intron endonuclease
MYGIIYITINKVTNRKYIGQHKCISSKFDGYLGSGKLLNRAIKKYGKENFTRKTLTCANTEEELNHLEREYIGYFKAIEDRNFYNIHVGGYGGDTYGGKTESEKQEFKKKMQSVTQGENNGMFGKHHNEETKKKIAENKNMEIYHSEGFRNTMKKATIGKNNGMYNKNHSQESKDKMSKNSIGKTKGNKNGMHGKTGKNAINGVPYQCYDGDNNLVKDFVSFSEVKEWLNINHHSGLLSAIKNNRKYKGFYWKKGSRIKKV